MFPRQNRGTTGVYSRSVLSGTGTTGSVVKMRLPGSISRATALNSRSPTASQRTDPTKSDVSALGNAWSMGQAVCPLASRGMLAAGLWSRRRKRQAHRSRRQRKAHFGELIQLDGSHHHWLEGRGPKACLMNFVDDATGLALCRFSGEETTWTAADLLAAWVCQHGVPKALYCDWKNVYQRQPTSREAIEGIKPETQFGRMCTKLGIGIIAASSPQAKGRVERHHGTHQDRLIKKMRLRGIVDYEAANRYLAEEYLAEHNERFACEPAAGADFHQALPRGTELRGVFCCEYERVVSNDRVVRFENRCLQLKPKRNQGVGADARVTVQQWRDESLQVRFEGHEIEHEVIATPTPQLRTKPAPQGRVVAGRKPAANHPWRRPVLRKTRAANS